MSGKHTPGPWFVPHFARPDVDCECEYVLTDGYMGAVCAVYSSGKGDITKTGDNPPFEEAVANAHLIAAAPELLDALEGFMREFGDKTDNNANVRKARAAIAKAKGGAK